jgi:hypothetical protein
MGRGLCSIVIAGLLVCGCAKKDKDAPRAAQAHEVQPSAAEPARSDAPVPAAKDEHPLLVATRAFLNALDTGNYRWALSLSVPGEFTEQGLIGMHNAFQWSQATFTQAWLGAEQSAVITSFVPAREGSVSAAWAINLVATEDGRWLVRLTDVMPTQQMIEAYLSAFHEVAPDAKSIEP